MNHYASWPVRARIAEFLGVESNGANPTAVFFTTADEETHVPGEALSFDMSQFPPCVLFLLENPNDLLLRPSSMRRVVLTLLSLGWHPRHIAGLVQPRFERDFGWRNYWNRYDPATRAEFFTRIFAGLVIAGYDDLIDFNCCSTQEQKICFQPNCQDNLARFRTSLLNRRAYGRLARRPFHRLFLPAEHSDLS